MALLHLEQAQPHQTHHHDKQLGGWLDPNPPPLAGNKIVRIRVNGSPFERESGPQEGELKLVLAVEDIENWRSIGSNKQRILVGIEPGIEHSKLVLMDRKLVGIEMGRKIGGLLLAVVVVGIEQRDPWLWILVSVIPGKGEVWELRNLGRNCSGNLPIWGDLV